VLGITLDVVRIAGGCTYVQGEMKERKGKDRSGVVREWTDVPLHHPPPFEGVASRRVRISRRSRGQL
jgi:hypothetical protein